MVKHYTAKRRDAPDTHLLRRAALSAEFALAQYLVKGIAAADADMIAEAEGMLSTLADDIAEYGGQPISVEPLPPANPDAPPTGQAPAAPDLVDAPAATDISEAMPAVHVTPIPVDAKPLPVEVTPIPVEVAPIPAEAEDAGGKADRPSDQVPPQSAVKDGDAGDDDAAEDAGAQGDAPAPKSPGADTSTVALTVVEAKTT